jgi:regulator of replication initiation timing
MKDRQDGHGGYVRRVQDNLQRYTRGLLGENETLRRRVAQLEADHRELAEGARQLEDARADNAALRTENGALRAERECLQERVAEFREAAAFQQSRQAEIESHLKQIEEANRRSAEEYVSVQQENANLANLYVASYRLHGTVERGEVVLAIQEIVANLIGSEELAILEKEPDRTDLALVASFGVEEEPLRRIAVGAGPIGRAAATGEVYVRGEGEAGLAFSGESPVTACIPLRLDGQVTGVIAIFRLLSHKPALAAADHELFDLLASQAAVALYCARLHRQYGPAVAAPAPMGNA